MRAGKGQKLLVPVLILTHRNIYIRGPERDKNLPIPVLILTPRYLGDLQAILRKDRLQYITAPIHELISKSSQSFSRRLKPKPSQKQKTL
jgi:hypothetical protein